jgi:acyl-coenzyme A thioesterase PaaI-like protein
VTSDRDAALRRLVDALRDAIDHVVDTGAPAEELMAAAEDVERAVAKVGGARETTKQSGSQAAFVARDPHAYFPLSPVIGHFNPLAPPVEIAVAGGAVRGTAVFGSAYEGPPNCVHGGVIAATFDELLGVANIEGGTPGMTGTLTIRYRRPTPLRSELRLEGQHVGSEGRKSFTRGAIYADDELTAEADGIFVALRPERAEEIFGDRPHLGGV